MKKLLLLDADVVIDLHTLGMFEKMQNSYDLYITKEVFKESKYYPIKGKKIPIKFSKKVTVIDNVKLKHLNKVQKEAREARLAIDPGEATSIAYLLQSEKPIPFCTCDKAGIKLLSYMELEQESVSVESAFKKAGHQSKLWPRHTEANFKKCINDGKVLRIQFKKLV